MVRVRKLVLAIAAATAMSSGMAHALGLGDVSLQSALNQPLSADIELLDIGDLGSAEVLPALASPEEFSKAGIDRDFFLTDLKFTSLIKPNGKSVIHVSSTKPVREPYLNFLVEVTWPSGRLLREYTLLLDPPLYSPQTAAAAAPQLPVAASAARPAPARSAGSTSAPSPTAAQQSTTAPARPQAASVQSEEYRTTANDTLWKVAERNRAGGSVDQAMLAIQDLNPDAFLDGNINRMKSGQVLRMPTEQQILSRSQGQAASEVASQNADWRSGRNGTTSARQLDASRRASVGDTPERVEERDNLRLVSPDNGSSPSGSDKGGTGNAKALSDKLAVTQESLDSSRRESDELRSRVSDLQAQLDKLQRLIQLKDDQLAKLQAELATQGKPAVGSAAPAQAPGQQTGATPNSAATPPTAATGGTAPSTPDAARVASPSTAEQAPPANTGGAAPASPSAAPAEQPKAAKPASAPTKPVPAQEVEPSLLDEVLGNPVLLGALGGGALLVLLIALLVSSRRRATREAELQSAVNLTGEPEGLDIDASLSPDDLEDLLAGAGAVSAVEERVAPQTTDALGEADIYIAYGRFNQAAELLLNAINDEPHRADLRLKLMEVYAELGDRDGFIRQENELREIGGATADVEQLKLRYPAMAAASLAATAGAVPLHQDEDDFGLDDLQFDEPTQFSERAETSEFDLDFDDLVADLDGKRPEQAAVDDTSLDSIELDDMDFSMPEEDSTVRVERAELPQDRELNDELAADFADFDLDLDRPFRSDETSTASGEPALGTAEAFEAAEREAESLPGEVESESELSSDFDLSLEEEPMASDDFAAHFERASAEAQVASPDPDLPADDSAPRDAPVADFEDEDFDFLSGTDETATKLDLARAYIDMGDSEGARDILDEVIAEGDAAQQQEARELLTKLA
jgi:pilus assembly protein FimV